ncbi:hypothetical protein Rs2_38491 [Raphanus sativus]|nr:hypothetical protein Rs2_38491 [Raphanus sativus]
MTARTKMLNSNQLSSVPSLLIKQVKTVTSREVRRHQRTILERVPRRKRVTTIFHRKIFKAAITSTCARNKFGILKLTLRCDSPYYIGMILDLPNNLEDTLHQARNISGQRRDGRVKHGPITK